MILQEKKLDNLIMKAEEKFSRAKKILENEYALKKSMVEEMCVDKNGYPIPWYTYSAIEFLKQLDLSSKRVFEFGAGNSSAFWASIAKEVISVEENEKWYKKVLEKRKDNAKIMLVVDDFEYCTSILKENGLFDVVIIDGKLRDRCAANALRKISSDGLIILDNSDWGREIEEIGRAIKVLKSANLIQVDFCGFGPINDYTWCTSFFFKRNFNFRSKNGDIQPVNIIGGIHQSKGE